MYPVEYEVQIYDEFSSKENKYEIIHGITFGNTYAEAMENIEEYYRNQIIDVKLYMNEEQTVYELDPSSEYHEYGWFKITNLEKTF